MNSIRRRDFIKNTMVAGGALILTKKLPGSGLFNHQNILYQSPDPGEIPDIVTITGDDPEVNLARLLEPLGGIGSFVKSGRSVGILANSPWKIPGYYTQPDVVIAIANLCLEAGASEIICFKPAQESYWERGQLFTKYKTTVDKFRYGSDRVEVEIPKGIALKKAEIFKEFNEADVFISIPVAKHHAGCIFSGNLKGMMGVSSSTTNRYMHSPDGDYTYDEEEYLAQCIADLNLVRKPDLCIIDAIECSVNNGPAGPGQTVKPNRIIAGRDPLATDVYASQLIGFSPEDILTFRFASEHGLGEINPGKLTLVEL